MIPLQDLAAWRRHAPWSNDVMVEQDYLLSRAVAAIFEDPFLAGQVAMRGGTVLHKGHLAPASRYSEDIDLVVVGDRPARHIQKALARVLAPMLGKPSESVFADVVLAVRNLVAKSRIIRTMYVYDPTSREAALSRLKIEANISENRSFYPLVPVAMTVPTDDRTQRVISVVSYDLDEMLATKLRALLQREHGRDLYDLWRAWDVAQRSESAVKVNPERVGAAFRFYMAQEGSVFDAGEVRNELDRRMSSKKFLNDMEGYLPAGTTYSPVDAYRMFCNVFLPVL